MTLREGNGEALRFATGPAAAVGEMARVLRPGGLPVRRRQRFKLGLVERLVAGKVS